MIGMDPEVKKYLVKIMFSLFFGLMWLFLNVTAGIYYEFAIVGSRLSILNVLFYIWFAASIVVLIWYYYRMWNH